MTQTLYFMLVVAFWPGPEQNIRNLKCTLLEDSAKKLLNSTP